MKKRTLRLLMLALLAVLTLCLLPNSASAAQQKLGTPTDLTWNLYADLNKRPVETEQYYGCVAWKPTTPISPDEPIQFEIKVYKDNELWQTILQGFGPQAVAEDQFLSCDVYAYKDFESGTYYFTVQAIDNSGTYANSKVAKSGTWKYTRPSKTLKEPYNLRWDENDTINGWPKAKWNGASGQDTEYEVIMYYGTEEAGERQWFHHQWKITGTWNAPPQFAIDDGLFGPGYYFFKVRALSDDITKVRHSPWEMYDPYHWEIETPKVTISNVASSGKLKLTWDKVEHAKEYEIQRGESQNGIIWYYSQGTTTSTSYVDKTATAGKVYYYRVIAVTETGYESYYSKAVHRRCDLARPEVTAKNVSSSGKINLSWEKISGAEKYLVYRKASGESSYTRIASTTSVSYTDKTAKAGTKYYYRVMAVHDNTAANSAKSVTVARTCDLARPVVNIKLKSGDPRLTWEKIEGAEKYYVYRATSKTGKYEHIKTTKTASSFTDTTAKSGKTYYYKVRAIHSNDAANSAYSAIDYITAK